MHSTIYWRCSFVTPIWSLLHFYRGATNKNSSFISIHTHTQKNSFAGWKFKWINTHWFIYYSDVNDNGDFVVVSDVCAWPCTNHGQLDSPLARGDNFLRIIVFLSCSPSLLEINQFIGWWAQLWSSMMI